MNVPPVRFRVPLQAACLRTLHWSLWVLLLSWTVGGQVRAQNNASDTTATDDGFFNVDTTKTDTPKVKVVKEKTDWMDPNALMDGRPARMQADFKLDEVMYPDVLDNLGGFSSTLGQWGKPYFRTRYGTDASNFALGLPINPVTGAENAYFIDPQFGMRYYDTHTPYVNAAYAQGKGDAAQIRVDIAQNIHPLVNASILYHHRQAAGVYSNFATDHNSIGATTNFHTLNERYQVYAHYLVQKHDDLINGGVVLLLPDSVLFQKGSQPVALADAKLRRMSNAVAYRQFYRLNRDTANARHQFLLYNGYIREYFINQYMDQGVTNAVNSALYLVYPTIGDSSYFYEKMQYGRDKVDLGLTYRLETYNWHSVQRIEGASEWGQFTKNLQTKAIQRYSFLWKGQLKYDPNMREVEANWTYKQTYSNVFNPESYAELDLAYRFQQLHLDYTRRVPGPPLHPLDSTTISKVHRPVALNVHFLSYGRNPTLQQAFGVGWPGNNVQTIGNFSNRRIRHFSIGLEWKGRDRWTSTGEQRGNSIKLAAFTTRQSGMIYFAPSGWEQVNRKETSVYAGGELKLRVHLGGFWLETETVMQGFSANSRKLDTLFKRSQPRFYTKSSIFYENKELKFASILRTGFDLWYFSSFSAPYFDPATQAFYRQGTYVQYAYPRLDVFFATQVRRAYIYFKMVNLLENLPQTGYFTTMGYPMQVRQFMLGLNWTFFD